MSYNPTDVSTWPYYRPQLLAHDVGRSRDRSTAVLGGGAPCGQRLLGIGEALELPQGLFASARANALAAVDRHYHNNSLIVADLSNDATYAETLYDTFGPRVIGVHITRHGDGMNHEIRQVRGGCLPVYPIGRTYLIELLHSELQSNLVRFADTAMMRGVYAQLADLELEHRESGKVYACPPGKHDDLGISVAMLVFAARHPHLEAWLRRLETARRPRRPIREPFNWGLACT